MVPLVVMSLRLFGIQKTVHILACFENGRPCSEEDSLNNARVLVRALKHTVQRAFWKGNCLSRSLVLHWMLKRRGFSSEFYIGVKTAPKFRAHAWVEYKGVPLNAGKKVCNQYQVVQDLNMSRNAFL